MRSLIALIVLALILAFPSSGAELMSRCVTGRALAFVAIQDEPSYLVGTIPSHFTSAERFFTRRFNCTQASAYVRRETLGTYQVRFPGISARLVIVTAISDEGVSASAYPLGQGTVRVVLRGPLGGSDVASRRDVPFSVVVY